MDERGSRFDMRLYDEPQPHQPFGWREVAAIAAAAPFVVGALLEYARDRMAGKIQPTRPLGEVKEVFSSKGHEPQE